MDGEKKETKFASRIHTRISLDGGYHVLDESTHNYSQPLLPKMHYIHPLTVQQLNSLRHQATNIMSMRLSRAEPPLRKEVIEYMLNVGSHMWSMRHSKANFFRIMAVLSGFVAVGKWFDQICHWRNPITTALIHVLFFILVMYPELILPMIFLYLFLIGVWHYRWRPRHPPHMNTRLFHAGNAHPDELDEEFDTFPTSKPADMVRMRYDRLRSIAGRVQTVVGDLPTQGERLQSLLSWRDPRATALFVMFCLVAAVVLYVTPFQVVALLAGFTCSGTQSSVTSSHPCPSISSGDCLLGQTQYCESTKQSICNPICSFASIGIPPFP